jgi:hypothetical protein
VSSNKISSGTYPGSSTDRVTRKKTNKRASSYASTLSLTERKKETNAVAKLANPRTERKVYF